MTIKLTRVTNKGLEFPLSATNSDGTAAVLTGAKIALLPKRHGPNSATVWTPVGSFNVVTQEASIRLAGPDADPTGATLISPEYVTDLWALPLGITDYDPVEITRVELIGGNPTGPPDAATVSYATTAAMTAGLAAVGPVIASDNWLKAWATNVDNLIRATTITRDSNGTATAASVIWPDGTGGAFTGTPSTGFPGAVDAYTVTYAGGTTKTVTQPALTRDTNGAVTNRPALTVA